MLNRGKGQMVVVNIAIEVLLLKHQGIRVGMRNCYGITTHAFMDENVHSIG